MGTIFYKKEGRKYIPVREYDAQFSDSLPYGNHLIMKYQNGEQRRYNIEPALAPMIAAARYGTDDMASAIMDASAMRPTTALITEEQREAWDKLKKAFGSDMFKLSWPSSYEIAEAGLKAMMIEAEKMIGVPAVKNAYDHFMMVYTLTKDQNE